MIIKKIEIHDFRGLSDVVIDNFDDKLNLFLGVNGAGKSSILDSIVQLLSPFTARLSSSGGKGIQLKSGDLKIGSKRGCKLSITLDDGTTWSKYKDHKLVKNDESDYAELNRYTKDYRNKLDNDEPLNLPVIVHYGVKRSVTVIPERFVAATNLSPAACYMDWQNSDASFRSFFEWFREEQNYENSLMLNDSSARVRGLEAIRLAMRIIFPDYTGLTVKHRPQVIVLKKGELEIPLESLSDGEKCYLSLVSDIVRRLAIANPSGSILKGNGIVLIDEVDLHLHPSWEATVMKKLNEVFPNIQFIVTSHSPLVASHFNGNVYAIDHGKLTCLPRLYGLDYSTILQDWMLSSSGNKELEILADLYKTYKENNMPEQVAQVWNRIMQVTNGDVSSPYFLDLMNY